MELRLSKLGMIKTGLHAVQGILVFITACIALAMDAKKGKTDGRGIWFNILCYLTIPALIYLAAVPMWERSQKFANVYAFLAVDVIFTIFWLSAWASIVSWARSGMASGAALKHLPSGNCTTFDPKFGEEAKCHLANTCTGFGVVIFILFIATAVISGLYLTKTLRPTTPTASPPWLAKHYAPAASDFEAGKDSAWNPDVDDGTYDPVQQHNDRPPSDSGTERGGDQEEDEYRLLQGATTDTELGRHPGRRWDADRTTGFGRRLEGEDGGGYGHGGDTAYHGARMQGGATGYEAPSALEPSGYGGGAVAGEMGRLPPLGGAQAGQRIPAAFPETPFGYDR